MTRQELLYPDAADRQRLLIFHKKANLHRWDIENYNRIKKVSLFTDPLCKFMLHLASLQSIVNVELDLKKLRDPLQIHVPSTSNDDNIPKSESGGFFGITNLHDVLNKFK